MTDVLKIALERRAELNEQVAKLDEFIRMAETLIRGSASMPELPPVRDLTTSEQGEPVVRTAMRRAGEPGAAEGTDVPRPSIIRRGNAAANG